MFQFFIQRVVCPVLIFVMWGLCFQVSAIDTIDSWRQVIQWGASNKKQIDAHGLCRVVTNNCYAPIFVPTKTSAEWLQWVWFVDKYPACVTLAPCQQLSCAAIWWKADFVETFSNKFTFVTEPTLPTHSPHYIETQSDGKLLWLQVWDTSRIYRYHPNGNVDSSFNTIVIDARIDRFKVITGDKILVYGDNLTTVAGQSRLRMARFNANGTFDATFDPWTIFQWSTGLGIFASDLFNIPLTYQDRITVRPDGVIVATYINSSTNVHSLRFLTGNWSLLYSVNLPYYAPNWSTTIYRLYAQRDNKVYVIGKNLNSNSPKKWLIRLNIDWTIDNTFNPVYHSSLSQPAAYEKEATYLSIVEQSNNKLVVAIIWWGPFVDGRFSFQSYRVFHVYRLNQNGSVDMTFQSKTFHDYYYTPQNVLGTDTMVPGSTGLWQFKPSWYEKLVFNTCGNVMFGISSMRLDNSDNIYIWWAFVLSGFKQLHYDMVDNFIDVMNHRRLSYQNAGEMYSMDFFVQNMKPLWKNWFVILLSGGQFSSSYAPGWITWAYSMIDFGYACSVFNWSHFFHPNLLTRTFYLFSVNENFGTLHRNEWWFYQLPNYRFFVRDFEIYGNSLYHTLYFDHWNITLFDGMDDPTKWWYNKLPRWTIADDADSKFVYRPPWENPGFISYSVMPYFPFDWNVDFSWAIGTTWIWVYSFPFAPCIQTGNALLLDCHTSYGNNNLNGSIVFPSLSAHYAKNQKQLIRDLPLIYTGSPYLELRYDPSDDFGRSIIEKKESFLMSFESVPSHFLDCWPFRSSWFFTQLWPKLNDRTTSNTVVSSFTYGWITIQLPFTHILFSSLNSPFYWGLPRGWVTDNIYQLLNQLWVNPPTWLPTNVDKWEYWLTFSTQPYSAVISFGSYTMPAPPTPTSTILQPKAYNQSSPSHWSLTHTIAWRISIQWPHLRMLSYCLSDRTGISMQLPVTSRTWPRLLDAFHRTPTFSFMANPYIYISSMPTIPNTVLDLFRAFQYSKSRSPDTLSNVQNYRHHVMHTPKPYLTHYNGLSDTDSLAPSRNSVWWWIVWSSKVSNDSVAAYPQRLERYIYDADRSNYYYVTTTGPNADTLHIANLNDGKYSTPFPGWKFFTGSHPNEIYAIFNDNPYYPYVPQIIYNTQNFTKFTIEDCLAD